MHDATCPQPVRDFPNAWIVEVSSWRLNPVTRIIWAREQCLVPGAWVLTPGSWCHLDDVGGSIRTRNFATPCNCRVPYPCLAVFLIRPDCRCRTPCILSNDLLPFAHPITELLLDRSWVKTRLNWWSRSWARFKLLSRCLLPSSASLPGTGRMASLRWERRNESSFRLSGTCVKYHPTIQNMR